MPSSDNANPSASAFASNVVDTLIDSAETQKNAGADAVASLARSVRDSADNLEERSPEIARLVRTSADAVERASANLRDQDLWEAVAAVSDFAARRPVAFLGCGVLAGVVMARLFSSSQR